MYWRLLTLWVLTGSPSSVAPATSEPHQGSAYRDPVRLGGSQIRPSTGTSRAATPDSPCNRTGQFGVVITWLGKDWTR